jgi:hypothetical protein
MEHGESQDCMHQLKALQLLVVENSGKLQELPDLATAPKAPSEALMRSCLISTSDRTVAVADELQFRMCSERARAEKLLEMLHPSQVRSGTAYLPYVTWLVCTMLTDGHQLLQSTIINLTSHVLCKTADAVRGSVEVIRAWNSTGGNAAIAPQSNAAVTFSEVVVGASFVQAAQPCARAVLQYEHSGDDNGLETVPHLEELAALFAGTGLGQSIIIAEHLLGIGALGLSTTSGDGERKVGC